MLMLEESLFGLNSLDTFFDVSTFKHGKSDLNMKGTYIQQPIKLIIHLRSALSLLW